MNDQFGHSAGDKVLREIVKSLKMHLRKTDVIARLGGDEFALLLPETDQESSRIILLKIHSHLLDEMRQNNWPITFSIGVMTCGGERYRTDELVTMVDELMYSAKKGGKNAIIFSES